MSDDGDGRGPARVGGAAEGAEFVGAEAGTGAPVLRLSLEGERLRVAMGAEVFERVLDRAGRELIDALTNELELVMARATRWGDEDQGSAAMARSRCELLFDAVWPGPVKAFLRAHTGPLAIAVEGGEAARWLEGLPFELMDDGRGLLGERLGIARWGWSEAAQGEHSGAGRALVVCDPRGDLIGAYHEGLAVRDELVGLGFEVDLRSTEVTALDVLRLLRDYELVHFAGHGERKATERGGPALGWWLKDEVLTAAMLSELAGGRPMPRLVFSNACRSLLRGAGAEGLAHAMMRGGALHVIGTTREVPDEVAALFALAFYERLAAGVCIGEAVREARLHLKARYGPGSVYGGAWVLFGDPGAVVVAGEPLVEPVGSTAILNPGLRLRGSAVATAGDAAGTPGGLGVQGVSGATGAIGATRGQALLAAFGALALVALLIAMVVSALTQDGDAVGKKPSVAPVGPRMEDPILRAHPVEHWPVQPLWGPAPER